MPRGAAALASDRARAAISTCVGRGGEPSTWRERAGENGRSAPGASKVGAALERGARLSPCAGAAAVAASPGGCMGHKSMQPVCNAFRLWGPRARAVLRARARRGKSVGSGRRSVRARARPPHRHDRATRRQTPFRPPQQTRPEPADRKSANRRRLSFPTTRHTTSRLRTRPLVFLGNVLFSICACRPCVRAMGIFSVSFQLCRMIFEPEPRHLPPGLGRRLGPTSCTCNADQAGRPSCAFP